VILAVPGTDESILFIREADKSEKIPLPFRDPGENERAM